MTRIRSDLTDICQASVASAPERGLVNAEQFERDSQTVDMQLRETWRKLHQLRDTDPYEVMRQFEKKYAHLVSYAFKQSAAFQSVL
eukprot:5794853-Amphidinium_carterae.1